MVFTLEDTATFVLTLLGNDGAGHANLNPNAGKGSVTPYAAASCRNVPRCKKNDR